MEENINPLKRGLVAAVFCIVCAAGGVYYSERVSMALQMMTGRDISAPLAGITLFFLLVQQISDTTKREKFSGIYRVLVWLSGVYIAILVYGGIVMVPLDVVFFIYNLFPAKNLPYWYAAGISLPASVMFVIFGILHARKIRTVSYRIPTEKITGTFRIVQLSDLHIGSVVGAGQMERAAKAVNSLHPDLIVITGDLINHGKVAETKDPDQVARILAGMKSRYGIFAVTGNHDPLPGDAPLQAFLKKAGIRLLVNENAQAGPVLLCGRVGNTMRGRTPLQKFFDRDGQHYCIVLDHYPNGMQEAADAGADLFLAGHTHQGQYFPCGFLIRKDYRGSSLHGHGKVKEMDTVVSAGTGYFQIPIRIGTDSEVVCIDLVGKPLKN